MTGGIAHDFNNMLTGIMGSLDIVKRRIAAGRLDDVNRFMEAATTSAQRAASLTHRLLAFSRRQSLDRKPTDIGRLIVGMKELLERTLGEQVALVVDPCPGRMAGGDGCKRTGKCPAEPCHQCKGRDAARRRIADRHAKRQTFERRRCRTFDRWIPGFCRRYGARYGPWHAGRCAGEGVRSVLYHQADRPGHRSRTVDGLRVRATVRRGGGDRKHARGRHHHHALSAAQPGSGCGNRPRNRARCAARHRRKSSGGRG